MTDFCARAWDSTSTLQREMTRLPFNVELADGSLPAEVFQFYLVQDARYLVGFGRALAAAAARADDADDVAFLAGAAREAVVTERALHDGYFERFGMSETDVEAVETSPTCLAYTSYLLATAQSGGYGELLAALLPCFWVYHAVGTDILARQGANTGGDAGGIAVGERADTVNPYRAWIDTYADEEFGAAVERCKAAVNAAAERADERTRSRMLAAFTRATEYEWMFWDSAYRREAWPTAGLRD